MLLTMQQILVSSVPFNGWFMRVRHSSLRDFWNARLRVHVAGILGGMIWMVALGLNIIASGVAGPAISYALGQGATLIAALWGVFIWQEFRSAPAGTNRLITLMLGAYALGIVLIG